VRLYVRYTNLQIRAADTIPGAETMSFYLKTLAKPSGREKMLKIFIRNQILIS
jgi:hypothetical protein